MNKKYEGYPNRETWLFYCWEGEHLENSILEYMEDTNSTLEYGKVFTIVNGHLDYLLEDHNLTGASFFDDMVDDCIRKIDLHYIAGKIYDEIVLQYNEKD